MIRILKKILKYLALSTILPISYLIQIRQLNKKTNDSIKDDNLMTRGKMDFPDIMNQKHDKLGFNKNLEIRKVQLDVFLKDKMCPSFIASSNTYFGYSMLVFIGFAIISFPICYISPDAYVKLVFNPYFNVCALAAHNLIFGFMISIAFKQTDRILDNAIDIVVPSRIIKFIYGKEMLQQDSLLMASQELSAMHLYYNAGREYGQTLIELAEARNKVIEIRNREIAKQEILNKAMIIKLTFTNRTRNSDKIKDNIRNIVKLYCAISKNVEQLKELIKQRAEISKARSLKDLSKRDKSANILKNAEDNNNRLDVARKLKKEANRLQVTYDRVIKRFNKKYSEQYPEIEYLCEQGEQYHPRANIIIDGLNTFFTRIDRITQTIHNIEAELTTINENLEEQFKSDHQARVLFEKEQKIAIDRKKQEEAEKATAIQQALEEAQKRDQRKAAEEQEDKIRREKYRAQLIAYKKQQALNRMADEYNKACGLIDPTSNQTKEGRSKDDPETKQMQETMDQSHARSKDQIHAGLNDQIHTRLKPRSLTLDSMGNISIQLKEKEIKMKAETELEILIGCVEACAELNLRIHKERSNEQRIFILLKIQRNALLGTLAQCMEAMKKLSIIQDLPKDFARQFRNYLFKSPEFLISNKRAVEEQMVFTQEIINMINELIHYIRLVDKPKNGLDSFQSPLFNSIKHKIINFRQTIPECTVCKQSIDLANQDLSTYDLCDNYDLCHNYDLCDKEQNDLFNPLLIACARNYTLAARGTFSAWVRDEHRFTYLKSREEYDGYIKTGNQIRHGERYRFV